MNKYPLRMCVSCRQMLPKSDLLRIVKSKDGTINLDQTGKLDGRGAYICKLEPCVQKCLKTRAVNRAFKVQVPQTVYDNIQCVMSDKK